MASWGRPSLWARIAVCTLCLLGVFATSALAATYSVTTTADDAGSGTCSPAPATCTSLRQAINTIDASPTPPDVIDVTAGDYVLSDGTLEITASMTIDGAGAGTGAGATTIDGNSGQVFSVSGSPSSVTLSGMNVQGSTNNDNTGGGIGFDSTTTATLTLSNDVFTNNVTDDVPGGAIYFDDGANPGALDITDTTISGNTITCCENGAGIAFENSGAGTLTIDGSTLSGNGASSNSPTTGEGGAVYFDGGSMTITNSTVSDNTAVQGAGLYLVHGATTLTNDTIANNSLTSAGTIPGAGIFGAGAVTANNTIISGNTGATPGHNDCDAHVSSSDHSLELGADCGFDLPSGDPNLEALGDNGGPTQTIALGAGSAAIDAGDKAQCPATDQRGFARPDAAGTACDIGAYESAPPAGSITTPVNGATFTVGQIVNASYACAPGIGAALQPGSAGCAAPVSNGAAIETSTIGPHSFTVVATDVDGLTTSATSNYTVIAKLGPPVNVVQPSITGTPKAHEKLSCSPGTWTNLPTMYAAQWSRNGKPLQGATQSTYIVKTDDAGAVLTCTITASNAAGTGLPATSKGVTVQLPPGCPRATGTLSAGRLGPVELGMTREQARRAFAHSSSRGKKYQDFFCLTPSGVRVGYASPKLLRTLPSKERNRLEGRVVWASTANEYYALDGIRPARASPRRAPGSSQGAHSTSA